ncbi:MAG: hypothetical protein V1688_02920 [bacterium]
MFSRFNQSNIKSLWIQTSLCVQDKITVEERMDQAIQFKLRGKYLNYKLLPEKPKKISIDKTQWIIVASPTYKPPVNHPWRQTIQSEYLKKN